MNAKRRNDIKKVLAKLEELDALKSEITEMITEIAEEEEEAYDNLPESLQDSERGEAMSEAVDNLNDAAYEVDAIDLEAVTEYLEEAMN